ncbi:hypothetical protein SAMN02745216_05028 [Desulfatibacillum alkenivorans DSM 16219]|jgi:hypothetical protein|uniref:Uncharacterized protein n=1 Tax=Desulfatibacillum alkenivorans DSM 16219 TaxID=1121393 RepID=A0A1M6ZSL7_9BACT|nr:hypothetical protein [Desulfatibacillum alkenivorans]SHL33462.1 hypothetical protein SAMN02745216_05028 [Desulfatibacillum alkenivorans DSM 16219]
MDNQEKKMTIQFTGRTAEKHKVPAAVLNQVLSGLQRAVHLLAMQQEEMEVRQKDRVTGKLEDKYVLLCGTPEPGSLIIPITLGDPSSDLFAAQDIEAVAVNLENFCRAVESQDKTQIRRIMPDKDRRKRLMESAIKMIPKGSTGIEVRVGWNGEAFMHSKRLLPALRDLSLPVDQVEELQTVTGRLVRIDFDARKVTIFYRPTGRDLECIYDEAVEDMLLDRPRELIQVTGVIRLDEKGLPYQIVQVEEIHDLILSRFHREEVELPESVLIFDPPLVLEPELVEDDQLVCLRDATLGIDVFASTIEDLADELNQEIRMLWRSYALENDSALSPKALELKRNLLKRIREQAKNG